MDSDLNFSIEAGRVTFVLKNHLRDKAVNLAISYGLNPVDRHKAHIVEIFYDTDSEGVSRIFMLILNKNFNAMHRFEISKIEMGAFNRHYLKFPNIKTGFSIVW